MNSQDRLQMPVGEAMFTQRAIRRLKPDPIPVDDIKTMLEAAVKAPNGGNRQPARFLVVNDPGLIRDFGKLYHEAWWAKRREIEGWHKPEDVPADDKTYQSAMKLADEIGAAPLIVLACAKQGTPGNSVFPWVQNLLLSARAMGIGSTLTTIHPLVEERVRGMFGIPPEMEILCCIPMGYPRGNFGPTVRLPSSQVAYLNQWNRAMPWGN